MVPIMALASTAKQNISLRSTLAHAAIMLNCILLVEAVLAWCCHMCPLSVAVECSR